MLGSDAVPAMDSASVYEVLVLSGRTVLVSKRSVTGNEASFNGCIT
jgi:hypothetical protein